MEMVIRAHGRLRPRWRGGVGSWSANADPGALASLDPARRAAAGSSDTPGRDAGASVVRGGGGALALVVAGGLGGPGAAPRA